MGADDISDTESRPVTKKLHPDAEEVTQGPPVFPTGRPMTDRTRRRLGPYRIIRELGRGGMGIVFLVEQEEPVRRTAALKIIQSHGDRTKQRAFATRFRTECNTLARLKHPNVALVYDAGESDTGEPYFVMEYLEGRTIADYCNEHELDLRQRLRLFIEVCHGVQHAHQRGIIHRDLKPSNIIVSDVGDRPVPKIIDFGVAKEIGADSSHTVQGELLGSPGFMSPEMLVGGAAEVDSRTDVYSLGAVLYQLLADSPPFALTDESFVQFLMRMVHEEPEQPSRRLRTRANDLDTISRQRATTPEGLTRALAGDLDWITMKAMHKDRDRRYATASELAEDVARHLRLEPVTASPLGRWYRLRKTIRRHRVGFALGVVLACSLVVATITTSVSLVRAVRSERRAVVSERAAHEEVERTRAINNFLEDLLGSLDPSRDGRDVRLLDLVDRKAATIQRVFVSQPEIEASVRHILGTTYINLGEYDSAEDQLRIAFDLRHQYLGPADPHTLQTRNAVARWLLYNGRFDESVALSRETLRVVDETATRNLDLVHLQTSIVLGEALYKGGDLEQAYSVFSDALATHEPDLARDHPDIIRTRGGLALVLKKLKRVAEAEAIYRVILEQQEGMLGPDHPETLRTRNALANTLFRQREFEKAEAFYRQTYAAQCRVLGENHPATLLTLNNIGNVLYKVARYADAETTYRQALEAQVRILGNDHPDALVTTNNLANSLRRQERYQEAEHLYRETLASQTEQLGPDHDETVRTALNLMTVLSRTGRYDEVIEMSGVFAAHRPSLEDPLVHQAEAYLATGRPDEAVAPLRRLTELLPEVFAIRAQLGLALLLAHQPDDAIAEYQQALNLSPSAEQIGHEALEPLVEATGGGSPPRGTSEIVALLRGE